MTSTKGEQGCAGCLALLVFGLILVVAGGVMWGLLLRVADAIRAI